MGHEQVVTTTDHGGKTPTDNAVENILDALTPGELRVLDLMAHGFSNNAITEQFVINQKSADSYINRMFHKIGVSWEDPEIDARVTAVLVYQRNKPSFENPVESYFEPFEITPLTRRQKEMVRLIGQGYSNKRISDKLKISLTSVRNKINLILDERIPVDREKYDSRVVLALLAQTKHVV